MLFRSGLPFSYLITYSSFVFVQAIQEVFMAKEWVKDARNKVRVEANFRVETSKALAVAKQKI